MVVSPQLRRGNVGGWVVLASGDPMLLRPLVTSAQRLSCVIANIVI